MFKNEIKMKLKPGDKVCFLNEKGQGTVIKILSKNMANVSLEDGFEIPFPMDQLVLMPGAQDAEEDEDFTEDYAEENREIAIDIWRIPKEQGISMFFIPENENQMLSSPLNIYLVNHTDYHILFTCSLKNGQEFVNVSSGKVDAAHQLFIKTIERKEIEIWTEVKIDVIFYKETSFASQAPLSKIIKLKGVKFYKESSYTENSFFNEKALAVSITSPMLEDTQWINEDMHLKLISDKQKAGKEPKNISRQHAKNSGILEMEVDLHIEELLENYGNMSNGEIIQVQLRHFQNTLDEAILNNMTRIIFIHGVGTGRLKNEIHTILKSLDGIRFCDASYQRYGYGATEVTILYPLIKK